MNSYDVILTNLRTPVMLGEDLYRRIEHTGRTAPPPPVFVTAALPAEAFRPSTTGDPPDPHSKPYTRERLLQIIDDLVAWAV